MPREIRLHKEDRYSRIRLVTGIDVRAIRKARVCIVGAGALGNEVIKNLALYAPARLSVVDRDYVELSNLGRCFLFDYKDAEMRRSKAKAVSRNVGRINPDCRIEPIHEDAAALDSDFFSQYDVVVGCVDNIKTRLHINSNCYFSEIPYIDGGIDGMYGRVQVILPPDGACYECTMNSTHNARIDLGYSCTGREANVPGRQIASEPSVCGIVGSLQALEGLRVISGTLNEGILLFFNGNESSLTTFDLTIDAKCTNHTGTAQ